MKDNIFYFFILFFNLSLVVFSFKCGHDKIKKIPKIINDSIISDNKNRRLDSYHSISFFVDYTQMDKGEYGSLEYRNFLKTSINSTLKIFSELIKVKRSKYIAIPAPTNCTNKITDYNINITIGIDYDIILIPIIDPSLGDNIDAAASACYLSGEDNRPIMGFVLLNQNYSYNKKNAQEYLTMLLLHEITHVLVFSESLFNYFQYSGEKTTTKTVNGINRKFLITSTVRNLAAQHFNCSSITGVELENQGGEGSVGSHWEARVMLGDYMISTDYPEIVISDISLALFKDSGWYDVNYYTGGLFRFGKGEGCKFLDSLCVNSNKSNFEFDFCDKKYENMCTSNYLNRGYCYITEYNSSLSSYYQYFDKSNIGGWEPADYCPVALSYYSSSYYFQSSCVNGELSSDESYYPSSLGFSISEKSICMKSSLVNASDRSLSIYQYKRSMCHKIECDLDSKYYTVDIGNALIECPTEGGEMEVEGYKGTITCPPFNRVCTSEKYIANSIQAALEHITNIDVGNFNIDDDANNDNDINNDSDNNNGNNEFFLKTINLYLYFIFIFLIIL